MRSLSLSVYTFRGNFRVKLKHWINLIPPTIYVNLTRQQVNLFPSDSQMINQNNIFLLIKSLSLARRIDIFVTLTAT